MVFAKTFRLIGLACLALGSLAIRLCDAIVPFVMPIFAVGPDIRLQINPRSIIETRRMGLA